MRVVEFSAWAILRMWRCSGNATPPKVEYDFAYHLTLDAQTL